MKPLVKSIALEKIDYYITHLSLVNCVLPVKLKPKEIEVLAHFMSFKEDEENERFNSNNRKIVRNRLNISHGGLSNYINSLKEKNFLVGKGRSMSLLPLLQPDKGEQTYMFKLKNVDEDE
jgi:DNA-binding MarR family transcriptional regulator